MTDDSMQEAALEKKTAEKFRSLLASHILPLLHGSTLSGPYSSKRRVSHMVSSSGKARLKVYLSEESRIYFALQSHTPYSAQEKEFIEKIILKFREMRVLENKFYHLVGRASVELAIAEFINPEYAETIYKVIQIYNQWSTQTYEGERISHSIAIDFKRKGEQKSRLMDFINADFVKILGSRPQTVLTIDNEGYILDLESVAPPEEGEDEMESLLAPLCVAGPALWSNQPDRALVHLTSKGEILLFKGGKAMFAKRRAQWRSFPHSMLTGELANDNLDPMQALINRSIYLTAIDVAFEHKGACIGVLDEKPTKYKEGLGRIRSEYLFQAKKANPVARLLATLVGGRKFYELPRQIRQELCAIDGAVILNHQGEILTAGAILKTRGNAGRGGGRTAAATALGETGSGIKISNDGYIEIYSGNKPPMVFL
ncbi:MAG: hypothetical protein IJD04_03350 [Desulfovibrionaceae bacterium]|nr:hypothetical protein [Desulfovibrionaceae bacterium]